MLCPAQILGTALPIHPGLMSQPVWSAGACSRLSPARLASPRSKRDLRHPPAGQIRVTHARAPVRMASSSRTVLYLVLFCPFSGLSFHGVPANVVVCVRERCGTEARMKMSSALKIRIHAAPQASRPVSPGRQSQPGDQQAGSHRRISNRHKLPIRTTRNSLKTNDRCHSYSTHDFGDRQ